MHPPKPILNATTKADIYHHSALTKLMNRGMSAIKTSTGTAPRIIPATYPIPVDDGRLSAAEIVFLLAEDKADVLTRSFCSSSCIAFLNIVWASVVLASSSHFPVLLQSQWHSLVAFCLSAPGDVDLIWWCGVVTSPGSVDVVFSIDVTISVDWRVIGAFCVVLASSLGSGKDINIKCICALTLIGHHGQFSHIWISLFQSYYSLVLAG